MQSTYQFSGIGALRPDPTLVEVLRSVGQRKTFAPGQLIQQQGDADTGFWMIESGRVSICRFAPDGGVTTFAVLGSGDLFGELAHFAGTARQVDAVAESAAVLVHIRPARIDLLLAEQPDFARWLLASLANQLRTALDLIDRDRTLSADVRLARLLLDLADREGAVLLATQQSLADRAGVSRVTVGQVLARLEQIGAIQRGYRKIVVADRRKLESYTPC